MVPTRLERVAHAFEDPLALVEYERGLAMDGRRAVDGPAACDAEGLVAQATPSTGVSSGSVSSRAVNTPASSGRPGPGKGSRRRASRREGLGGLRIGLHDLGRPPQALDQCTRL